MAEETKQEQATEENVETTDTNEDNETTTTSEETVENTEKETNEKTFTQTELEDIISKRLERERKKFEGYDDLKKKASQYEKELEEKRLAEMSEKERAEEIAKKAEEDKSTLEQQLQELRESVQREKITNEFIRVATSANVQYIDDAIKLADLSAVTVNEEGNVENMEDVIKTLVEHKPFLVATKKAQKAIGESTNTNSDKSEKTADQLIKEAAERARQTGKPEDKMAYAKLKRELRG